LVFQILAFAAAGVAGFAASHYLTTQQLVDTARQEAQAAESEASATAPTPGSLSGPIVDGSVAEPAIEANAAVSGAPAAAGPDRPNSYAEDSPPGQIAPSDAEDPTADGDGSRLEL